MTGWPVKVRWVDGTSWSIGSLVGVPTDEVLESSQRCSVNMFFFLRSFDISTCFGTDWNYQKYPKKGPWISIDTTFFCLIIVLKNVALDVDLAFRQARVQRHDRHKRPEWCVPVVFARVTDRQTDRETERGGRGGDYYPLDPSGNLTLP